ncbi:MAG: glycosyltransferase family 4 protein [Bernardetiaceae bacterium]|jgi:glycosyltransferase involved in cell wall biosynthesis|nr:glycosyltransferase family 4 protein [Bernardetiaceae bacterium]
MKIFILNTHPIQYFAPLYKKMAAQGLDLEVWYCSDESLRGEKDQEFGVEVKWDIPLLEGYAYRFFPNYARRGGINGGFSGLLNWGVLRQIWQAPRGLAVVTGWGYLIQWLFVWVAKLRGHQVALRCDAPLSQEIIIRRKAAGLRRFSLKFFLFKWIDHFLYVGQQNKQLYQFYGVADKRLIFSPFSVDNERFSREAQALALVKKRLKQALGLPLGGQVILYVGKYTPIKRPLDLLAAYQQLGLADTALVMVGEGELRPQMEQFIHRHQLLAQVYLTGFVNQSAIAQYYALADVLVMCSERETWGLSTNEAMNFGVPVILSDQVGCAADLVPPELAPDHIFPVGDVAGLAQRLAKCLQNPAQPSWPKQVIAQYSYDEVIAGFQQIVGRESSENKQDLRQKQ